MDKIRAHPVTVFYLFLRYIFAYLIPALGIIVSRDSIKQIAWWNISLFASTLIVTIIKWRSIKVTLHRNCICVASGIFIRSEKIIPFPKITSIDLDTPPLLKLTGSISLRIETNARRGKKASLSLRLYKEDAYKITNAILGGKKSEPISQFQTEHNRLTLMLISSTNAAAGFLFAYSVFSTGGTILGRQFQQNILTTLEGAALYASKILPPALSVIGVLLLFGWIVSFIKSFSRYYKFTVLRKKDHLVVISGLITLRESILFVNSINSVEFRQTLLLRLLNQYSVYLQCAGYGKQKGERAILIPAANYDKCINALKELLPEFEVAPVQISPPKRAKFRYISKPFSLITYTLSLTFALFSRYPRLFPALILFSLSLLAVFLWQFIISLISFQTSGAGKGKSSLTISYHTSFCLRRLHIPIDKVHQTALISRGSGNICDFEVFVNSDKKTCHKIRGLDKRDAKKLIRSLVKARE